MADLLKNNKKLIGEVDFDNNPGIDFEVITLKSNKKIWWKCGKGHPSYLMSVSKRSIGNGCPVCSNHRIIKDINDFETLHLELMDEWMWEENDIEGLHPDAVSQGSGCIAWWKCRVCGSTWRASIVNRARKHSGCPYCANRKVKKGYNDFESVKPELVAEWDYSKNGSLTPDSIVAFSAKKVWWKCRKCGNSWQASPNQRAKSGCPYCSNYKKIKGFNDFETKYPELASEWDYEKNVDISPSQFAPGSEKKVWWKCEKGHSWKAQINSRANGRGCPICSNKQVLVGFNDLFTTNPELKEEWDFEKNTVLSPYALTAGTTKKAWWLCRNCGLSWQAGINSRARGTGCPDCGKVKNQIGRMKTYAAKNPLFEKYPELEKEWDYEKNKNIDIALLSASSNKVAWWKCEKGHSYKTKIVSRTSQNVGCPYCHNQKVLTGINDLQTLNPELAAEWDYDKNYPLKPSEVFSHAAKHVWWICPICGNSWKAKIHNRANGRGCPKCNQNGTSFIEQALFYYVQKVFPDARNRYEYDGMELDIYIPSSRTGIEYDGSFYHSEEGSEEREVRKDQFCKDNDIRLIRLREKPLPPTAGALNVSCDCTNWNNLESTCRIVLDLLRQGTSVDISISRDYTSIIDYKKERLKENSFGKAYPQLLTQWDYEKNVPLVPDYFSRGSNMKVWWKCEKGHEWQAAISNRCQGAGCPVCSNRKAYVGYNDLKTTHPAVADEWNCEKNGGLKPEMFKAGSNKRVWWKCSNCGHEWESMIYSRSKGSRCPNCKHSVLTDKGISNLSTK